MLTAAIICFALAAVGGITLAFLHRGEGRPPTWLAVAHGGLAATGLVLFLLSYLAEPAAFGTVGSVSLGVFVVAALGGFYLFSRRFLSDVTPMWVILIHGTLAATAFVLLLLAAFG